MGDPFKLTFTDPDELEALVEEYFQSRWKTRVIKQRDREGGFIEFEEEYQLPPTMAGLARHLGVVRSTLWNYVRGQSKNTDNIRPVVVRALNRIAEFAEEGLYTREGVTGARFTLEVNHGYGKEDTAGSGGFTQNITPPASIGSNAPLAIAKWEDDDDD